MRRLFATLGLLSLLAVPAAARGQSANPWVDTLFQRANAALIRNDPDLAIALCNQILGIDFGQWGAFVTRSNAHLLKRDWAPAVADANRALAAPDPGRNLRA